MDLYSREAQNEPQHSLMKVREAIKKKCVNKENVLINFDPLPPPPNKEIKNKEIFVPFFTPSLLP